MIFTDFYNKELLSSYNRYCRSGSKPTGFIYGGCLGLYNFVFVDFGPEFACKEPSDEEPRTLAVSNITNDSIGKVTVCAEPHRFSDGDSVTFTGVRGMEEINGKIFQVKLLSSQQYAFCIGNTSNYGKYQGGGDVREVIPSKVINFKTFEESLLEPSTEYSPMFEIYDFEKIERGGLLHIALRAFLAFAKEHDSALPKLNHDGDSEEFVRILTDSVTKNTSGFQADQFDDTLLDLAKKLALFSRANIPTHMTFWGGVIAQEALKITGKLMPYCQWFHFENYECVPETSVQEREPLNCRYDDFIAVFGRASQNKLSKANVLLAGAGSMGLEFSKLFALGWETDCRGPQGP